VGCSSLRLASAGPFIPRVARTINSNTNLVAHTPILRLGLLTMLFSCSSRLRRSRSPAFTAVQTSILPIPCKTVNLLPLGPTIATLPKTGVSNPCVCHRYDNPRGPGPLRLSDFRPANVPTCFRSIPRIFILLRTLLHFFALSKNSTLLFSSDSTLCVKKPTGAGGGVNSHSILLQERPPCG